MDFIERFNSNFTQTEGCWEWQGSMFSNGYGRFGIERKSRRAHRVSYEIHKGEIPANNLVRHTCDNRRCVNPNHLLIGTHSDNMKDMTDRGRQAKGLNQGSAKLSQTQIDEIRELNGLMYQKDIAEMYGVSQSYVSHVLLFRKRKIRT